MSRLAIDSTLKLNNGTLIPRLGLGVYLTKGHEASLFALQHGYRHVDTAQWYENEAEVGEAVRKSGLKRSDIFVTTKIWDTAQGEPRATQSIKKSLETANLEFFDCILIHSPNPGKKKRLETYQALINAKKQGWTRSIGVSNYGVKHIREVLEHFPEEPPSMNQIEISPYFQRKEIVDECRKHGIALEAYSPLGKAAHVNRKELHELGKPYNKTPSQVLIRWSLQRDFICLPKSSNPDRIKENANVFDFELSAQDMAKLDALETGSGVTWDPTKAD